jgi:hypothetical protein
MKEPGEEHHHVHYNWTAIYLLIAGVLLLLIVLFYIFTKHFE